jgi:hypothetical protein
MFPGSIVIVAILLVLAKKRKNIGYFIYCVLVRTIASQRLTFIEEVRVYNKHNNIHIRKSRKLAFETVSTNKRQTILAVNEREVVGRVVEVHL